MGISEERPMFHIKFIVSPQGQPTEVVLPWPEYLDILEYLGMDLDEEAQACLREARHDRESGNFEAYVDLDSL